MYGIHGTKMVYLPTCGIHVWYPWDENGIFTYMWYPCMVSMGLKWYIYLHVVSMYGIHGTKMVYLPGIHVWYPWDENGIFTYMWYPCMVSMGRKWYIYLHVVSMYGIHGTKMVYLPTCGIHVWYPCDENGIFTYMWYPCMVSMGRKWYIYIHVVSMYGIHGTKMVYLPTCGIHVWYPWD